MVAGSLLRAGICLSLIAILGACDQGHKKDEGVVYTKPVSDSINPFIIDGAEIDSATVSSTAQAKMLDCDGPSTEQRVSGSSLSTSYKMITRSRQSVDSHVAAKDEERGYSTNSDGTMFKRMYRLNQFTIDGVSGMGGSAVAFQDTCTSNGCDVKQREYIVGSAAYLMDVDLKIRNLTERMSRVPRKICELTDQGSPRRVVQQGTYNMSGVAYRAVKYTTRTEGDMYCDTGAVIEGSRLDRRTYMGKGQRTQISIVLADRLPQVAMEFSLGTSYGASCGRTTAFSTSYIESSGKIYAGSAQEIVGATITGKILSVNEYRSARQAREDLLKRLRDAVTIANSTKNDADNEVLIATTRVREAKLKESSAKESYATAETIAARSTATQEDKDRAVRLRVASEDAANEARRAEATLDIKMEFARNYAKALRDAIEALRKVESEQRF